jgi:hypothetical protein
MTPDRPEPKARTVEGKSPMPALQSHQEFGGRQLSHTKARRARAGGTPQRAGWTPDAALRSLSSAVSGTSVPYSAETKGARLPANRKRI